MPHQSSEGHQGAGHRDLPPGLRGRIRKPIPGVPLVRPVLLFFNKIILTCRLNCGRMAPKGGVRYVTLTRLPLRRLCRGALCGHRPLRPPAVLPALFLRYCRYPAHRGVDDGPLSSRRVGRVRPPGLEPSRPKRGVEGGPLPRPVCLGLGPGWVAADPLWPVPSAPGHRGDLYAPVHLRSGRPLLCPDAGRHPGGAGPHRPGPVLPLVRLYVPGGAAAPAALLPGVPAAPPGKGGSL